MMKSLEYISYTDLLTGLNNRNSMNDLVTAVSEGTEVLESPFGIVFCDLNGLKRVNDSSGHSAGDLLLKKAALLLQEVFTEDSIYRAGGDEFMIIVRGRTEEAFTQRVETLKNRSCDPKGVCFAVGSCFDGTGADIRKAMHNADVDMYQNKKEFYENHPELKS